MQVSIYKAKTSLSKLVGLAANGEEVIITQAGEPVAKLVQYEKTMQPRPLGLLKGQIVISDSFYNNSEIYKLFYE